MTGRDQKDATAGEFGASRPWDTVLRLDPSELERLRAETLEVTLALARKYHAHYATAMQGAGIEPGDIDGCRGLELFPLTWKQDFLLDPESFRLSLPDAHSIPLDERVLHSIMYTTGSKTGVPTPIYNTGSDYYGILEESRRAADKLNITSSDRIGNVFPLTPYPSGGYFRAQATAAAVGAASIVTHTGRGSGPYPVHRDVDTAIDFLAGQDVTIIWGVTSFVARLLARAAERAVRMPALKACLVTGERISENLEHQVLDGMREVGAAEARISNRYGFTEGTTLIPCGDSWHNLVPEQIYLEAIDPDTGRRVSEGEPGLLAVTHLRRRGTVLLRYVIGDRITLASGPCPHCGITVERVTSNPRREGLLQKIKGTMVDLDAVVTALEALPGLDDFQLKLVRSGNGGDEASVEGLVVRMATFGRDEEVVEAVIGEIRRIANLSPQIEHVTAGDIFDPVTDVKRKRIV